MIILSQRDPRWASSKLGQSNLTCGRWGCTTTAISMVSDYFGCYVSPLDLSHNVHNYTKDGLVVWEALSFRCFKGDKRTYGRDDKEIRAALKDPSRAVILEVDSSHWVVALAPTLLGNDYRIADPWFGDKCVLSKRYKKITGAKYFSKK